MGRRRWHSGSIFKFETTLNEKLLGILIPKSPELGFRLNTKFPIQNYNIFIDLVK